MYRYSEIYLLVTQHWEAQNYIIYIRCWDVRRTFGVILYYNGNIKEYYKGTKIKICHIVANRILTVLGIFLV